MNPFCVSFSPSGYKRWWHVTSPNNHPYDDWVSRCKPQCAAFVYSDYSHDDVLRLTYLPYESLVHVALSSLDDPIDAILRLKVDYVEKTIRVVEALCDNRSGGGLQIFVKAIDIFTEKVIFGNIVKEMFGDDWCIIVDKGNGLFDATMFDRVRYFRRLLSVHNTGPWNKTIGIYDVGLEVNAATRIQSAFRGWRARIEFRFDPNTTLGKYCVEKMFQEVLHAGD